MKDIDIRDLIWGIKAKNASISITSPSSMAPSALVPPIIIGCAELREDGGIELREDGGIELEEFCTPIAQSISLREDGGAALREDGGLELEER